MRWATQGSESSSGTGAPLIHKVNRWQRSMTHSVPTLWFSISDIGQGKHKSRLTRKPPKWHFFQSHFCIFGFYISRKIQSKHPFGKIFIQSEIFMGFRSLLSHPSKMAPENFRRRFLKTGPNCHLVGFRLRWLIKSWRSLSGHTLTQLRHLFDKPLFCLSTWSWNDTCMARNESHDRMLTLYMSNRWKWSWPAGIGPTAHANCECPASLKDPELWYRMTDALV